MADIAPISTDANGVGYFAKQEVSERLVPETGALELKDATGDGCIDVTDLVRLSRPMRKQLEKRTTILKKSVKSPQELESSDTVAQQKLQRGENPRLGNGVGNTPQVQSSSVQFIR